MNHIELREAVYRGLVNAIGDGVLDVYMISPVPGQPVELEVETSCPVDKVRKYKITIEEMD